MAMQPKLWALNGLATELGVANATIAKALRDVKPDGTIDLRGQRFPAWRLSTARRALDARAEANRRRLTGGGTAPDREALAMAGEIETRLADVEAFLEELEAEPDVVKRRELVKSEGGCIGALDRALAKSIESDGDMAPVFEPMRERVLGELVGQLLKATSWELKAA
ncbi:hypothetical protein [Methylocystis suflitae]|uniref:hypothetical protein n=1 Tax=Methylocystis suflitae TaxID=2951405 RepID=UPI00210A5908|nr:hypothetical protein [Methylocystis suflitae]MCQ4189039.1 hypothetical protein [Methylocystis suflitae]